MSCTSPGHCAGFGDGARRHVTPASDVVTSVEFSTATPVEPDQASTPGGSLVASVHNDGMTLSLLGSNDPSTKVPTWVTQRFVSGHPGGQRSVLATRPPLVNHNEVDTPANATFCHVRPPLEVNKGSRGTGCEMYPSRGDTKANGLELSPD